MHFKYTTNGLLLIIRSVVGSFEPLLVSFAVLEEFDWLALLALLADVALVELAAADAPLPTADCVVEDIVFILLYFDFKKDFPVPHLIHTKSKLLVCVSEI